MELLRQREMIEIRLCGLGLGDLRDQNEDVNTNTCAETVNNLELAQQQHPSSSPTDLNKYILEFNSLFAQLEYANNKLNTNLEKAFQQFTNANEVLECKRKLTQLYKTKLSTLHAIQQTIFLEDSVQNKMVHQIVSMQEIPTKEQNVEEKQEEQQQEIQIIAPVDATIENYLNAVEESYELEKQDDLGAFEKVGREDRDKDETVDDVIKAAEQSIQI